MESVANILLKAHSGWRWIVVLVVLASIVHGIMGWMGRKRWTSTSKKLATFTVIAIDIQVLLGLVFYGMGKYFKAATAGTKYFHPLLMILAMVIVHVMSKRIKSNGSDIVRYQTLVIGTVVALVLIILGISMLPGGASRLFSMS